MAQIKPFFTPEEYLALERASETKHEYYLGDMYAMAGGTPQHSAITANVIGLLYAQLRGKPCQIYSPDLKVRTDGAGLFSYPDVTIVCGTPKYHDAQADVLTNPTVLIEVLSPSTEAFDKTKKFAQYQNLASLRDYLLVAQSEPHIMHYARQGQNQWLLTNASGMDSRLHIPSLECILSLSDVYERIDFPAPSSVSANGADGL